MGVASRRPPLPAPTDISSAENGNSAIGASDDQDTEVSRQTERTSYSLLSDGSPVTITTERPRNGKEQSQTSLLIELWEGGQAGDKSRSHPSVRVRVRPSGSRKSRSSNDAAPHITEAGSSRKPLYTKRIPLQGRSREGVGSTEVSSASDESGGRPPVEVEVLHNFSDLSQSVDRSPIRSVALPSDVSSMPPDTMSTPMIHSPRRSRSGGVEKVETKTRDTLHAPSRSRSRSLSRERVISKAVEKLQKESTATRKHKSGKSGSRSHSGSREYMLDAGQSSKSRSGKHREESHDYLHPSEVSGYSSRSMDQRSVHSVNSSTSINNPKLLSVVEDTIKRLILPELTAVREEQRKANNRNRYEETSRDARAPAGQREESRGLSKSSSLPSVSRKSEVSTHDKGLILPGDAGRRRSRRSSKDSTSDRSYDTAMRDESSHRKSSREQKHGTRDVLAAGLVGAAGVALTSAALKHHQSSSKDRQRRKSSGSKSRSRSASFTESVEELTRGKEIPPLPMQSMMDSDLTRDSILSADTERPASRSSRGSSRTPVRELREVARGSPLHMKSSTPGAYPRSPASAEKIQSLHDDYDERHEDGQIHHRHDPSTGTTVGIAAAGLGAAALAATAAHQYHKDQAQLTPTRNLSPIQSDASSGRGKAGYASHARVRSIKSDNSVSSERHKHNTRSDASLDSSPGSPSAHLAQHKTRPEGISLEKRYEILPEDDIDEWLAREHQRNDRYREELDHESQAESTALLEDSRRMTMYTEDSVADDDDVEKYGIGPDIRSLGANPEYVRTPVAVESAVASLQEPSTISVHSSEKIASPRDVRISQPETLPWDATARKNMTIGQSRERWEAVRNQAMATAEQYPAQKEVNSPPQSEAKSPAMSARAMPTIEEPAYGYGIDDESEMITNPSVIDELLGGPDQDLSFDRDIADEDIMHVGESGSRDTAALLGAAAGAGLGLAALRGHDGKIRDYNPTVEDELDRDLDHRDDVELQSPYVTQPAYASSTPNNKDEGYQSAPQGGGFSPIPYPGQDKDMEPYMDDQDMEDPFTTQKHLRHESGLSHGMGSPLYDSATGKGIDRIQSKDIVALMDHLAVRDGQRNARDTEILITLVRSAAEMRNSFEDMKRFIAEQDRLIMNNMDRGGDITVQRVLNGPRPFPTGSPRTPRRQPSDDADDIPMRRKNVFRRALRGLSMRSTNDLTKIEDMFMQLLSEVEGLKDSQGLPRQPHTQTASLNSYDHLRMPPDPGYEPEGQAGTSSSPAQSGYLSNPSSRHVNGMHSGYDGPRASEGNRISTVLEGDEEVEIHDHAMAAEQYQMDEHVRHTPSQELHQVRSIPMETPPEQTSQFQVPDHTPRTDRSRKHKSNASSLFSGFPRISRWSKTTASTAAETRRESSAKKELPMSQESRSGSDLQLGYDLDEGDRLRSANSLIAEQRAAHEADARLTHLRSQSPLIPEHHLDDPKYQAHRNSLNLQHPQPRPGPTHRHQTYLESQAINFEKPVTPDADHWGSAPSLALNRSRFSGSSAPAQGLSPVYSDDEYEEYSPQETSRQARARDNQGPLVPPKVAITHDHDMSLYDGPMSGSGMHIASPLEPIEEVRYSLETDPHSARQEHTPSPRVGAMRSVQRKITGPREMPPPRSPSGHLGASRRSVNSASPAVSYETYRTSLDSDTF